MGSVAATCVNQMLGVALGGPPAPGGYWSSPGPSMSSHEPSISPNSAANMPGSKQDCKGCPLPPARPQLAPKPCVWGEGGGALLWGSAGLGDLVSPPRINPIQEKGYLEGQGVSIKNTYS